MKTIDDKKVCEQKTIDVPVEKRKTSTAAKPRSRSEKDKRKRLIINEAIAALKVGQKAKRKFRLKELKEKISNGTYKMDSQKIAQAIMEKTELDV